jgi:hypothetical protein
MGMPGQRWQAAGGERNLVVFDARDVFHGAFAVRCPSIDAKGELSPRCGHLRPLLPQSSSSSHVTASGMLLNPLPEACKVKKPVQDLTMETWPVLRIFGWHADPSSSL